MVGRVMRRLVSCLLILLGLVAGLQGQEPSPPENPAIHAKAVSAQAQLALAKRMKQETRGKRGERRLRHLRQVVRAFEAVAMHWPESGAILAEAHFRRAETLRSLEEPGAARGAFEDALEAAGEGDDLGARSLLEIGHLCRRAGQHVDAMRHYRRARDRPKVSLRLQNDGREWLVRVLLEIRDWEAAALAAEDWGDHAEGTVERVRAADLRLLAWIGLGRLHEVWKELEVLRENLEIEASAPTSEGAAVRRALESMKAGPALRKARRNGR